VLTAAVALARSLGLITVVEGIETEAERAAVTRSGADLGQGFLLARPMTAADMCELIPRHVDVPLPSRAVRQ
jgi:EAL domain-containing protein (putative c-di-GMP-specific phosphodiesterase class I)